MLGDSQTKSMTKRWILALLLFAFMAATGVALNHFVYIPWRMRCVISRIESAKTPAEERAAFRLARHYGPFYRIELPRTNGIGVGQGPGFLIVFRQVSPFTHQRYSATRTLLAYTNELYLESNELRRVDY